jgi:hypothetical protein
MVDRRNLRRTSAFTSQEARIHCTRFGSAGSFDDDPMFPVVAKIVDVVEFSYA